MENNHYDVVLDDKGEYIYDANGHVLVREKTST